MRDLTPREKFILGGAAATALLCFFPWVSVSVGGEGLGEMFKQMGGGSAQGGNGFSSAEGVIAFLAALATVGLVVADRAGKLPWPQPTRLVAPLVSAGVAMLCLLIAFGRFSSVSSPMVSVSRSFWFYIALIAMGFATFHAFQRWTEGSKSITASDPSVPPPA